MTSILGKIFRNRVSMAVVFLSVIMIGTMTGCGRTEAEPESLAEEISERNTVEGVLLNMSAGADEMLSSSEETEAILNPSTEKTNDTSDMATVTNESSWYGSYIVKDYIIRGVTAIGNDEAEGLMMCLMEYGPDEFNSDGILLEAPTYKETLVSREEFAALHSGSGGGCTFETFGIEGDSLLEVTIDNSSELGNTFYVWDANRILIYHPGGAFLIAERGQRPDIVLTDEHKSFLQAMCYYMPTFAGVSETKNEDFWGEFIFNSFTDVPTDEFGNYKPVYGAGEHVMVYREDWGMEEEVFKISETYVQEYAHLIFGAETELPEFKPAFEDVGANQTLFYYQDRYYYIGGSDFGDEEYRFRDMELFRERYGTSAIVYYDILMLNNNGEREVAGTVLFDLYYANNANGFTIASKEVEWV